MKILYVTTISNTITFFTDHIIMLLNQGHKVDLACNIIKPINPQLLQRGCRVFDIEFQRSPLKIDNLVAFRKIKRLVLNEGYDLIHVHTPVASFLTRLACRNIPNISVLYTAHGFHFFKGAPLKNWLLYYPAERLAARWTDAIITINKEDYNIANKMKLRKPKSIYKVHGVGIDLCKFSSPTLEEKTKLRIEYRFNNDDFILFYAAELNYNKHQDLLINVINLLKVKIPNIKLLLAGNGISRGQYEEQTKKLGLQANVKFLGFRKDIPALLKISDIAVASSRREGLPVNVIEAMAVGLPLVITNCRGQRDLVSNGQNGYLVDINDIKGFAHAIIKLYQSQETRQKFGKKNIEHSKKYSLDKVVKEMEDIYSVYLDAKKCLN